MNNKDLSILHPYCENDMRKLKKISRSIFMRFNEPLANSDYDDFYSIANMTLWQAYNSYDPDKDVSFEGFLYSCLEKKFKSELTNRHRHKRIINQFAVSLDSTNESEEESCLLDYIPSDFCTFDEVVKRQEKENFSDKIEQYISKLSTQQINILNFLINGYKPKEIRQKLMISEKRYTDELQFMRSYENIKFLF